MVNKNLLKGKMAEAGMNQKQLAQAIGMAEKTLSIKINTGKFGLDEADKIISVLHIQEPSPIFFAPEVT
jgi:DNA-binding XRE family transcriptional regulator